MKLKIGICQMGEEKDKNKAINKAGEMIEKASKKGAKIVVLPEMWNCPYALENFRAYGEEADGPSVKFMSNIAKEEGIYLIGGSIPEIDGGLVFNTSFAFDPNGHLIGKHRKVHLFDVNVANGPSFQESELISAGEKITLIDTQYGKIGIAICYDLRFPYMFRKMALEGAKIIVVPAAFSLATGKAHWELILRARAVDSQVYMIGAAPALVENSLYSPFAHSMITDPWARVLLDMGSDEDVGIGELDLDYLAEVREQLPCLRHGRDQLYL